MKYSIQPTSEGGFIIIGSTKSFSSSSGGAWLIKTDLYIFLTIQYIL